MTTADNVRATFADKNALSALSEVEISDRDRKILDRVLGGDSVAAAGRSVGVSSERSRGILIALVRRVDRHLQRLARHKIKPPIDPDLVEHAELNTRAFKCLRNHGFQSRAQVNEFLETQGMEGLLGLSNCGKLSASEIWAWAKGLGPDGAGKVRLERELARARRELTFWQERVSRLTAQLESKQTP